MRQLPKKVSRFFIQEFWPCAGWWAIAYAVLSILDTVGFSLMAPFFLKYVVAKLQASDISAAFHIIVPVAIVWFVVRGILVLIAVLRWAVLDNRIRYRAYNKISSDLYHYVFKQDISYFSNSMPGKIGSQINQISDAFGETIGLVMGEMLATLCAFAIAAVALTNLGWQYVALISACIVFRIGWGMATYKMVVRGATRRAKKTNTLQGHLLDALSNFPVVKLFARADWEQQAVMPARNDFERAARNSHFLSRIFWVPGNFVVDAIGFGVLILLCGYMYSIGASSLADVSFVLAIFGSLSNMSLGFIMLFKSFIRMWGNAVGSYAVLVQPIKITDAPNAPKLNVTAGNIEIKNLTFRYGMKNVLRNVSLNIKSGERIGLVGFSGAGKTTLVNLIMRLYDVTRGHILIDGQDIRTVTQDSLHENISFIPQEPTMFNRSLRENIEYGKIGATMDEIRGAAHLASADAFIKNTQDGYETIVGDRGIKLSGGQRQRVAIARAFLKNAPILILDEATAALDSETEAAIQKSFDKLTRGRTTIVIAHRLSTLRNMDRIVVLHRGQVAEVGTHIQLLRRVDGIYKHLWEMQSGGFVPEK